MIINIEIELIKFEQKYNSKKCGFVEYYRKSKSKNTDLENLILFVKSKNDVPFLDINTNVNLTISETERSFSTLGNIVTKTRNRLSDESILYLNIIRFNNK